MTIARRGLFPLMLAIGLVISVLAGSALAPPSTWYVDNTGACDDGTVDSSVTPYCTIQAAVDDASSGDTIDIGPGTYTSGLSAVVYIGQSATKNLTLQGAGEGTTILDGQDGRIGIRVESASTVFVSDLTVYRGYSTGSGGGLYSVAGSTLIATDVTVSDAVAEYSGAGAYVGGFSFLELHGVTIDGGDAKTAGGGGIGSANGATIIVDETTISNCVASHVDGKGGAILMVTTGTNLTITESVFSGNDAGYQGGAFYLNDSTGNVSIDGSTFIENGTGGVTQDGGAIFVWMSALPISNSLFVGNHATGYGGAIADFGATIDIVSTTITSNQAGTYGGGLGYFVGTMSGSTVTENSANDGGGLGGPGAVPTVRNSIIADNTATSDHPDCDTFTSAGHDLIGDTTGCVIGGDTTGNILNQDPLLGALKDNGGPTKTYSITDGSPPHNAGNPGKPDGVGDHCAVTDQRGWDRDGDEGRCDIGAFELLLCGGLKIDIAGTPGVDTLIGTPGDDVIAGFGGQDKIDGNAGNDTICGGDGSDTIQGGDGKDTIYGGSKHDTIWGGPGKDRLFGEDGQDLIYGEGHHDIIKGGRQADILWGGLGDDRIKAGPADDTAYGQKGCLIGAVSV